MCHPLSLKSGIIILLICQPLLPDSSKSLSGIVGAVQSTNTFKYIFILKYIYIKKKIDKTARRIILFSFFKINYKKNVNAKVNSNSHFLEYDN